MQQDPADGFDVDLAPVPVADTVRASALVDVEVTNLAPVERAATLVHTGDMADCDRSYQVLQQRIDEVKRIDEVTEAPVGWSRQIYLDCAGPRQQRVTDLQFVLGS